jgi:hypothetical protein
MLNSANLEKLADAKCKERKQSTARNEKCKCFFRRAGACPFVAEREVSDNIGVWPCDFVRHGVSASGPS